MYLSLRTFPRGWLFLIALLPAKGEGGQSVLTVPTVNGNSFFDVFTDFLVPGRPFKYSSAHRFRFENTSGISSTIRSLKVSSPIELPDYPLHPVTFDIPLQSMSKVTP